MEANLSPQPYDIRFMRCHVTEEAAKAVTTVDIEAFKKAFPDAEITIRQDILREYFADYSLIACLVTIRINADANMIKLINMWLNLFTNAIFVEAEKQGIVNGR